MYSDLPSRAFPTKSTPAGTLALSLLRIKPALLVGWDSRPSRVQVAGSERHHSTLTIHGTSEAAASERSPLVDNVDLTALVGDYC